ncbi:ABC transporter ATP-binding protein [Rhizobium leguminosarum]|uniref:ABC transporter ATP-binding protein n=1 Tax=Rhizobium leguminosarum TaxID=384 RepID=UPI000374AD2B|nr:ABC transporter ATP-binding protein [Rhizobium leguminosarum]MBY5543778.1 ABC transporter ATP-binding protein [Rhizobium leguminosarum]MBY5550453.1 ABC transporter ATP-binding protein [Rhizobium leguminosarum]MBY5645638.1 ABC transporter ATP-binding protein [Rhizobium leguminosarum]MBY5663564.1 ABC transporter ATP-binding protein [Rhizobium leguminosarum]MBY5678746.1 ABC transporter ATP-binding protein [Rhizobium leguminosarum]
MPLVEISNLKVAFSGIEVLHGVDLAIEKGEAVGLVGESGCGKSVTWLAALGLLPGKASVSGSVRLGSDQLIGASRTKLESIRGGRIAMIFQDPSSSLNPVIRAGRQIAEAVELHRGLTGRAARNEAIRLMEMVGIPDAVRRFDNFPHEFSGGQNQRLMIAMALAGNPDLLIADEPTTALDATIQAQILDLLISIRQQTGMAIVFISHDLGAVSQICERVCVMYAGNIVEKCPTESLFRSPRHPYTRGLFDAIPRIDAGRDRLVPIPGTVPQPGRMPGGCAFAPRCGHASELCHNKVPPLVAVDDDRATACFHPLSDGATASKPNLMQAQQGVAWA